MADGVPSFGHLTETSVTDVGLQDEFTVLKVIGHVRFAVDTIAADVTVGCGLSVVNDALIATEMADPILGLAGGPALDEEGFWLWKARDFFPSEHDDTRTARILCDSNTRRVVRRHEELKIVAKTAGAAATIFYEFRILILVP